MDVYLWDCIIVTHRNRHIAGSYRDCLVGYPLVTKAQKVLFNSIPVEAMISYKITTKVLKLSNHRKRNLKIVLQIMMMIWIVKMKLINEEHNTLWMIISTPVAANTKGTL